MSNPLNGADALYVGERRALTAQVLDTLIRALDLDLTPKQIGLDSPLFGAGLGLDSVDAVAIAAGIESMFLGIRIDDSDIPTFRSVNSIVDFIMQKRHHLPPADTQALDDVPVRDPGSAPDSPGQPDAQHERDYRAIRDSIGMLSYSRQAIIRVRGPDHETVLDSVVAGNLSDLAVYGMMQTVVLSESGHVEALVWIGREDDGYFLVVAEDSGAHILQVLNSAASAFDANICDVSGESRIMSIAGPGAQDFMTGFFNEDILRLGFNEFTEFPWQDERLIISRYGETGEFDYRIMIPAHLERDVGEALRSAGTAEDLTLCSDEVLATLCLEMKSMTQDIVEAGRFYPSELDLQCMVWARKDSFRGKDAALDSLEAFERRSIILAGRALPAEGAEVRVGHQPVGIILAGAYSLRLESFIALAAIDKDYAWPSLRFVVGEGAGIPMTSRSAPLFLSNSILASIRSEEAVLD